MKNKRVNLSKVGYSILSTLSHAPLHGYGILKDAKKNINGRVAIGTLYSNLDKLIKHNLIEKCAPPSHVDVDPRRKEYYRITKDGRKALQDEREEYARLISLVPQIT